MIRRFFAPRHVNYEPGFRWRGGEVSRVEGFSDAVFAFAVTLLVVSLEVPKTFGELLDAMRGFIAFGLCFAILIYLWHIHYLFFRRYGLHDIYTIVLNSILLFVVLFYIYPLKFVFSVIIDSFLEIDRSVHLPNGTILPVAEPGQGPTMMLVYNAGYTAVFVVFVLLYLHAYRKRDDLRLNQIELHDTKFSLGTCGVQLGVSLVSSAITVIGGEKHLMLAGFSYFLVGPAMAVYGAMMGKKRKKLMEQREAFRQQQRAAQSAQQSHGGQHQQRRQP